MGIYNSEDVSGLSGVWASLKTRPRRPLRASGAGKRLECPTCREACTVKGGGARTLPVVYDILSA